MVKVVDVYYEDVEPKQRGASMPTYNNVTLMPIPSREDGKIETKIDNCFVLPDVHSVHKNIVFRTPKLDADLIKSNKSRDASKQITLGIRHGMLQLLEELAAKRPLWRFEANNYIYSGFIVEFIVSERTEELGRLVHNIDYASGRSQRTDVYKIYNHRINEKLDRKDHKTTTNIDTAIRTVLREFGAKNLSEIVKSGKEAITKVANAFQVDAHRKLNEAQWNVRSSLMDTLEARPDMFMQFSWYNKLGAPCVEHAKHVAIMDETKIKADQLMGGKLVIQRGDTYIVVDNVNNVSYTHQTLPYAVRSKLGMLKLVEPNEFVSGVGFKSDQECFFIFDDVEQQHNEE
jgi:hypothetical protein